MKINTKYHGEVEIKDGEIINFDSGIPGFLEENKFIVLPFGEENVFFILQSAITSALAFVVVNPFSFFQNYDFTLDDQTVEKLQLISKNDVAVYVILTVQDPFNKTTANLQAPIVINKEKMIGKQVILTNAEYETKHSIFNSTTVTK